jgi:hypothetical protein
MASFHDVARSLDVSDLVVACFLDIVYKLLMNRMDFKESLKAAKAELAALQHELGGCLKHQEELEKKIAAVRQMITGFSDALGEQFVEEDSLGLTDAIRQAFRTSGSPMTPTDVKGRLETLGYDTSKYGNMMASVHSVINRLVKQGQIRGVGALGGKPAYQWSGPSPSVEDILTKAFGRPAAPIVKVTKQIPTETPPTQKEEFKPKYGQPDPLNQRKK